MQAISLTDLATTDPRSSDTARYARCIRASKRVRWDIDADVIRGRDFDSSQTFLPDRLSKVDALGFLDARYADDAHRGGACADRAMTTPGMEAAARRAGAGRSYAIAVLASCATLVAIAAAVVVHAVANITVIV